MTDIQYLGENLIAGTLGKFFIFLSIFAGILSFIFYVKSLKASEGGKIKDLKKGRLLYYIETGAVVLTGIVLFYLILGHHFEYAYIYKHTSVLMPGKYIISSFWAGQEGSFLLWAILIAVFGILALRTSKKLEGGVMAVVSASIIFLMSMILGVDFLGIKLGSNPFELLRIAEASNAGDFFKNPNYLSMITDGNGLNPLLENPWMVIHPPMLFMGYATALFPFAFALASLIQNDKRYWIKLALPWVLLSVCLLGAGLILGGAWAYQSLTFGGFWAWDPVENASLVPWLVLVAVLHYLLLTYKRNKFYWGSYIFSFLGFLTVIYASYLTRSGVLGETSVHAFGDDGLTFQLITFMVVFTVIPIWLLIKRRKSIPYHDLPDIMNREFMMLYGSVIILLSSFQIISTTSIPVLNKIINGNLALGSDVVGFYNSWQMPFAMLVALLLGVVHYLSYENNDKKAFWRGVLYPLVIAFVLAVVTYIFDKDMLFAHALFLFLIVFAIFSSLAYIFRFITTHRNLAAGITHLGFSIFLLGVLVTFSNKMILSSDASSATQGNNVMLFKGQVKQVGDQLLSYSGSKEERDEIFYQVDFFKKDPSGQLQKKYSVYPSVKYNDRMGNVHNPDTRNMLTGDVFMYLTFAEDRNKRAAGGYSSSETRNMALNDTIYAGNKAVKLDSLTYDLLDAAGNNIRINALLNTIDSLGNKVAIPLTYKISGNIAESGIASIPGTDMKLRFDGVADMAKTIKVSLLEKEPEFIVLKIMFFPWIMILWLGAVIMFTGLAVAIFKRVRKAKED